MEWFTLKHDVVKQVEQPKSKESQDSTHEVYGLCPQQMVQCYSLYSSLVRPRATSANKPITIILPGGSHLFGLDAWQDGRLSRSILLVAAILH
jgi:hypothetical protein